MDVEPKEPEDRAAWLFRLGADRLGHDSLKLPVVKHAAIGNNLKYATLPTIAAPFLLDDTLVLQIKSFKSLLVLVVQVDSFEGGEGSSAEPGVA